MELREGGWTDQARILAERAASTVFLNDPREVAELLKELWNGGWIEQAQELTARLPAAGSFDLFLRNIADPEDFRFGREPDGIGSPDRTWDDLF